jgi:release factor glutamine methyltransferase
MHKLKIWTGPLVRGTAARPPSSQPVSTQVVSKIIHFFSYHLLLSRRQTTFVRAAGLYLVVPPTVFHPRFFLTSEFFAGFIAQLDLTGKRVADLGTGTGILALTAARAGAAKVVAIDVNPNATRAAAQNAEINGLSDIVTAVCSNFFSSVAPQPQFDVIFANPPYFCGEPRDLADRAWHAGPGYRDIAHMFEQARERLSPGGRMYVITSSNCELDSFVALMERAKFQPQLAAEKSAFVERFLIFMLVKA